MVIISAECVWFYSAIIGFFLFLFILKIKELPSEIEITDSF